MVLHCVITANKVWFNTFLFLITGFELWEEIFPSHIIQNLEPCKFNLGHSPKFTSPCAKTELFHEVKLLYY